MNKIKLDLQNKTVADKISDGGTIAPERGNNRRGFIAVTRISSKNWIW